MEQGEKPYAEQVADCLQFPDLETGEEPRPADIPEMEREKAMELIRKHRAIMETCIQMRSFPYYAADKIREAEAHA